MVQWFKDRNGKTAIFADAVAMLQSIGFTHTFTQDSLRAQEYSKKILLGSDIKASIRASFSTVLPSILVVNNKETMGGAYECLVVRIKDYSIWHLRGDQGSSVLRTKIWEGTTTVTGNLNRLTDNFTTYT